MSGTLASFAHFAIIVVIACTIVKVAWALISDHIRHRIAMAAMGDCEAFNARTTGKPGSPSEIARRARVALTAGKELGTLIRRRGENAPIGELRLRRESIRELTEKTA